VTPAWHPRAAAEVVALAEEGGRRLAIQVGRIYVEVARAAEAGSSRWATDASAAPGIHWWSTEDLTVYAVTDRSSLVVLHVTRTGRPYDFATGLQAARQRWQEPT
jgi:hypothetical protein